MEPHELNRMFDALAPTSEQAEACLNRLLQTERKDSPMKKIKKLPVIFVAAVLMVAAAAAAVAVTGIDQRIAAYFGAGEEQAELLVPGALDVDVTAEDNGAVLHVSQVLMDRYSILVLADFTAPEGTVLDLHTEEDGSISLETDAEEDDLLYDDISSGLLVGEIRRNRQEMLESLQLYYRVFILHEPIPELD